MILPDPVKKKKYEKTPASNAETGLKIVFYIRAIAEPIQTACSIFIRKLLL